MATKRILIVDDNVDQVKTFQMLLTYARHDVRGVTDASDGLELVKNWTPDVILLDIGLPRMDGYEAVQRFRGCLQNVRVYAVTGYGSPQDRQRALDAGFDDHFAKPVEISVIERLLAQP